MMGLGLVGMRSFERRVLKSFMWEANLKAGNTLLEWSVLESFFWEGKLEAGNTLLEKSILVEDRQFFYDGLRYNGVGFGGYAVF